MSRHIALMSALLGLSLCSSVFANQTTLPVESSYQQALDKMDAQRAKSDQASPINDQDRATMKNFNAYLAKNMPNPGLAVGQRAPDFNLKNAFGKTVSLADSLKSGPVILVFYRGSWCPYCNLHLHVLQKAMPEFAKHNAQIIAVTPQTPDRSAKQIEKDGYPFEVLSDGDSQVMKNYRLYFELSDELLAVYKKFNLNLEAYNGKGRTVLPVPGSFVINRDGIITAMQAQTDYKSRMEPQAILDALAKMDE